MLLVPSRFLGPQRLWTVGALRLLSSDEKGSRPSRRKVKGSQKDNKTAKPKISVAPTTSQLLEDFLIGATSAKTKKDSDSKPAEAKDRTDDTSGEKKSPQYTKPVADENVIKSIELFRDFVNVKGQPLKQLTHASTQNARRAVRVRHTERLPEPAKLQIFDDKSFEEPVTDSSAYNNEVFKEIEMIEASAYRAKSTHNKFEELIQWTLDGKLWRYPIDNEQDWIQELETPFHEHVFLSRFLKSEKGGKSKNPAPLKTFMDLVCAGLGQNPYISAQEKREHLAWFEGYFADKIKDIEAAVEEERRIAQAEAKARAAKK